MSDHWTINSDSMHDRDLDYAEIFREAPYHGKHSCWNDVLRAASRPPLRRGGWRPITSPPPPGFPDFNEFYRGVKLDINFLFTLPEFWHWDHPQFGYEVELHDMDLLHSERMSLIDLFMRGPVSPLWYDRLHEAEKALRRSHRGAIHKRTVRRIEQLEDDLKQAKDEGAEEQIKQIQRQLRDCRASELAIGLGRTVLVNVLEPTRSPHSPCLGQVVYINERPRSASDAHLHHHSLRLSRSRDTPIPPRTIPVPKREQTKPIPTNNHFTPIDIAIHRRPSSRYDRTEAERPSTTSSAINIENSRFFHPPAFIMSLPSLDDMKEKSQSVGLDIRDFVEHLETDTQELEWLAKGYRRSYERVRAELEDTDRFGLGGADVDGTKWEFEPLPDLGEGTRLGKEKGKRKGKERARDV
ncbi:hypothetical protein BU25DRAFT_420996 [Macroventuria anomochaeta]|uniref:Uncharacterized protein n=1 Tax=Macroventuria anomochaeta TaxID=301207 RepID=A0ACB6S5Q3_9PLEO|nr:uncharacterized protein BU25DRAFT_420996 [Macroventuria anomochaeta]KAF2628539.1 hypothetical protein BU25DRAFT_420996 [Macroventuria anomochaeta]